MDRDERSAEAKEAAGWNLLAAMEKVIHRLIGEPRVDFRTVREMETMRDELEGELNEQARERAAKRLERGRGR